MKRGNTVTLECKDSESHGKDVEVVKWFFTRKGSDEEKGVISWNRTYGQKSGPLLTETNPSRYAFDNEIFQNSGVLCPWMEEQLR